MKFVVLLYLAFVATALADAAGPGVYCADEPEAKAFLERMPEMFTASQLSSSDQFYEKWLDTLATKKRLPIRDSNVIDNKYVVAMTDPQPIAGWDGSPVQFAAVIAIDGEGDPAAVLIIAASDRRLAKAYCANFLRWKFKSSLGQLELRPGIFKTVPVITFLYTRQTFSTDPDKTSSNPPPMQVFAKIIN